MNIQQLPLDEIQPYERNPRKNDKAVAAVAESIRQYGFLVPIVISSGHEIVAGHTRYKAAQTLRLETIPCVVADELTEAQARAFRLIDNKTGEIAEWDLDMLAQELEGIDLSAFTDLELDWDIDLDSEPGQKTNTGKELSTLDYGDDAFTHQCPQCGFRFNDEQV